MINHVVIVVANNGQLTCGVFNYDAVVYDRFFVSTKKWSEVLDIIATLRPIKITVQPSTF